MSSSSSRSRFAEQLGELNSEIAVLSERLRPDTVDQDRGLENDVSREMEGRVARSDNKQIIDPEQGGAFRGKNGVKLMNSKVTKGEAEIGRRLSDGHGEDVYRVTAERDALQSKCNKLERVVTDLRHELSEMEHTKMELTHLKRDHATLTTSLETSERIRQQQKALITMLQTNNSKGDSSSLDKDAGDASNSVTPSVVAENRVWLNTGLPKGNSSVVSGLSGTDTDGESKGSSKKVRRRRNTAGNSTNKVLGNSGGVAFNPRRGGRNEKDAPEGVLTKGPTKVPRKSTVPKATVVSKPRSGSRSATTLQRQKSSPPSPPVADGRARKSSGSTTGEDSQLDSLQLATASAVARRQREYADRLTYGPPPPPSSLPGTPARGRAAAADIGIGTGEVISATFYRLNGYTKASKSPLRSRAGAVSASPMRVRRVPVPASPRCTFGSGHK